VLDSDEPLYTEDGLGQVSSSLLICLYLFVPKADIAWE
jgi:hypothetical protein